MSVSEIEIDFSAEIDSIHLSASAAILMRYVQFGNLSPIANDVASADAIKLIRVFEIRKSARPKSSRTGEKPRRHRRAKARNSREK
jgi:hypothetical protein